MKEYCKACLHRGDAFCELPRRGELAVRAARLVVALTAEAIASAGIIVSGSPIAPPDGYGLANTAKQGVDAVRERVEACIDFHETLAADPLT